MNEEEIKKLKHIDNPVNRLKFLASTLDDEHGLDKATASLMCILHSSVMINLLNFSEKKQGKGDLEMSAEEVYKIYKDAIDDMKSNINKVMK